MKLELIILGLLTINPCTGYDIKKYLDSEGRFAMSSRPLSQIYNTLKRMVKKEWIEYELKSRKAKPDLKIYSLKPNGREYFIEYLKSPVELVFRYRESDIPTRILFSYLIEPEVMIKNLEAELNYRRDQIAQFRNRDRTVHSSLLLPDQVEMINEIFDKMHFLGAKGIDDYVVLLEDLIDYFEHRKNMEM